MKTLLLLPFAILCWFSALAQDINSKGDSITRIKRPADTNIANGQVVDITTTPWQISLQRSSRHDCGGSILNPLWILTAAHCVTNGNLPLPVSSFKILAGTNYPYATPEAQLIQISQIIVHPNYNSATRANDIALVRLETPLRFGNSVQSIQYATELNLPDNLTSPGAMLSLTGWGVTTYNNPQGSSVLLGITLPIISSATANQIFQQQGNANPNLVTEDMLAIFQSGSGKGGVFGDSGGGMVVRNNGVPVLAGVFSFFGLGPNPSTSPTFGASPTVGMKVKSYSSWIQDNIAPQSWSFMAKIGYTLESMVRIVSRNTGMVLEVAGSATNTAPGSAVQQGVKGASNQFNQQWRIEKLSNGHFKIIGNYNRQSLQITGSATNNGALATQSPYIGGDNQQWKIESIGDGYYKIIAKHSNKALEIGGFATNPGAAAIQWDYVGGVNQQWIIEDISTYGFISKQSIDRQDYKVVGLASGGQGAAVVQQPDDYLQRGQQWQAVSLGGGVYKLVSQLTGQVLEIGGGSTATAAFATANQWPYFGGSNQKWQLERGTPTGGVLLIAQHSGQVLEVGGYSAANGAPLNQYPYTGASNQIWEVSNYVVGSNGEGIANRNALTNPLGSLASASSTLRNKGLLLFPNPASSVLNLELPNSTSILSATVLDMQGKRISTAIYKGNGRMDITNLVDGLYLITVNDGKREYHQKFVKW